MKSDKQLIIECRKLFFEGDEGKNKATFDRCILHVQEQGKSKDSAYAICTSAGAGKKKESVEKLTPYKSVFKEGFINEKYGFDCGFAIHTSDEATIQENWEGIFFSKHGHTENVPPIDWDVLNKEIMQMETNAIQWLKKHFDSVSDEGHDKYGDLIGTVWMDGSDTKQLRLLKQHYEDDPVDGGMVTVDENMLWKNVNSEYSKAVDISITFFNVPENIKEDQNL